MSLSRAEAYKNRRISAAIRGGFSRLNINGTQKQKDALKRKLTNLWDKSIGKECPLLCGRILSPRLSAFCHDKALAAGGEHIPSNIFLGCRTCNKSQHTMSKVEYLQLRQLIIDKCGKPLWDKIRLWLAGRRY